MTFASEVGTQAEKLQDQVVRLREQVEVLMKEKVTPAMSAFAGQAEQALQGATKTAREQAEAVSGQVKQRPLTAILIAAAVGWAIGRVMR